MDGPHGGWLLAAANPDGGPVLSAVAHTWMGSAIQSGMSNMSPQG